MEVKSNSSPFGSATRTRVLLALELLSESYPRELERILRIPISVLQKALLSLERDGLVAGRNAGRTRLFRLDPRYFAYPDLRGYLQKLSRPEQELRDSIAQLRRRPRRSGKPL